MNDQVGERFPKCARIRLRREYIAVQNKGLRVQSRAFIGLILTRPEGQTRLGITVTKKFGNAVARNRTKRLVRETFRRGHMSLPDRTDIVVIAKKKAAELDPKIIIDDLAELGKRVKKLVEQDL